MAEQDVKPLHDYGEDVDRYLVVKGSNIDELSKWHRHNVAESGGSIEADMDDNRSRDLSRTMTGSSSTATPIAQRPEKWHRNRPTVDADWSKVHYANRL